MIRRGVRWWTAAGLACAALAVAAQIALGRCRGPGTSAFAEGAFAALGGLRSLAAEIVWFRADRLQEEGRYVELAQLAETLALAEPHTPEVWSHAAWNLAYNVSVMMPTLEDRWRWIDAAIRLLRDRGLAFNPTSAELHRELAWLFELKMGLSIDAAAPLYRQKWKACVEDVARRGAWSELAMDETRMGEIDRHCPGLARTDPLYSAVYWAYDGLRFAEGRDRRMLSAIIEQSMLIHRRALRGNGAAAKGEG